MTCTPPSVTVLKGLTQAVALSAVDGAGNIVLLSVGAASEPISWSSNAPTVATVTGTGPSATISGVAAGTATISGSLKINSSGQTLAVSVPVTVTNQAAGGLQPGSQNSLRLTPSTLTQGWGSDPARRDGSSGRLMLPATSLSSPVIAADGSLYFWKWRPQRLWNRQFWKSEVEISNRWSHWIVARNWCGRNNICRLL